MSVPVIDATIAGAGSNSYVTLAEADAYFSDGLRAGDWQQNSHDRRIRALISATQTIQRLPVDGVKSSTVQALYYPREVDGSVIIAQLKIATFEQALWMLNSGGGEDLVDHAALQAAGVGSFSLDGISVSYVAGANAVSGIAPLAAQLLIDVIPNANAASSVKLKPQFDKAYRDDYYELGQESVDTFQL